MTVSPHHIPVTPSFLPPSLPPSPPSRVPAALFQGDAAPVLEALGDGRKELQYHYLQVSREGGRKGGRDGGRDGGRERKKPKQGRRVGCFSSKNRSPLIFLDHHQWKGFLLLLLLLLPLHSTDP